MFKDFDAPGTLPVMEIGSVGVSWGRLGSTQNVNVARFARNVE